MSCYSVSGCVCLVHKAIASEPNTKLRLFYPSLTALVRLVAGNTATMITFTPLSGAARSSRSIPLAYLLQVDDVRILLDCGSPDWCPESSSAVKSEDGLQASYHWEDYCQALREYVIIFYHFFMSN